MLYLLRSAPLFVNLHSKCYFFGKSHLLSSAVFRFWCTLLLVQKHLLLQDLRCPQSSVVFCWYISLYKYEAFTYIKYVRTKVAREMSRDLFAHWSSDRRIMLVALHSEKVIGTVGIDYTSDPNTCEIKRMVVLPEYQGRGIGKKLLCTAEQTAISLGYRKVFLVTGNFQPRAIKFYNHMQYHPLPVLDESLGFLSATRKLHPFEKIL